MNKITTLSSGEEDLSDELIDTISSQLHECADTISHMDLQMQDIKDKIYPRYPKQDGQ